MLLHSPNLRNVYRFALQCPAGRPCNSSAAPNGGALLWGRAGSVRHWCVAPLPAAGEYSVAVRWLHSEAQRMEMLEYAHNGSHLQMAPPVLIGGPPLPCTMGSSASYSYDG